MGEARNQEPAQYLPTWEVPGKVWATAHWVFPCGQ